MRYHIFNKNLILLFVMFLFASLSYANENNFRAVDSLSVEVSNSYKEFQAVIDSTTNKPYNSVFLYITKIDGQLSKHIIYITGKKKDGKAEMFSYSPGQSEPKVRILENNFYKYFSLVARELFDSDQTYYDSNTLSITLNWPKRQYRQLVFSVCKRF